MIKKSILVTGGAGFLGSNLCERLLKENNHVICLDNFFTGSRENIKPLLSNPDFEVIRHDIIQPYHIEANQIYNLACPASPVHYQYDPVKTNLTSTIGIYNLLEEAKRTGARVLQASTSEVYGDPIVHPQTEEYWGNVNPIGPRACYDEGKRAAEAMLFDYHRKHNVDIRVARIFNTYGPNMNKEDGRVVSNFIVQALKGEPLTMYGDGEQTRSFCYVDDLIDGLVKLMDSDQVGPINLGNPQERTMLDLAENVLRLTESNSELIFKPLPENDPTKRCPDITKAKTFLDWNPEVDLKTGLTATIDYFKKQI